MSKRRFPIALIVLIALAAGLVACGDDGGSEDPQTVIDEATLQGIESGALDLTVAVDAKGEQGGDLDLSLSGPFEEGSGEGDLPQLDLIAKADGTIDGDRIDFDGGLVLLPSSAYVNYRGVDYEVDPTTYSFVESIIDPQSVEGAPQGESTSLTACQETVGELEPADFFTDKLKDGGQADVDGTETTKVSGELDVPGSIDSLIELSKDPACKTQLNNAAALPSTKELEEARSELKAVKSAKVDVYVGDDDIVRRISAQLQIDPRKDTGKGPTSADVDFDLTLTGVNEEQEIAAPQGAKPLSDLFFKLGINPLELLGLLEGDPGELLERFGGAGG